jgi:hypothetical protein
MNKTPLTFSQANMKLAVLAAHLLMKKSEIVSFDLPAGYSCPMADICKTYANKATGKMRKVGAVTCYASKAEAIYPNCRKMRWSNFDALIKVRTSVLAMAELLDASLPKKVKVVRIHSSGDFFSREYFQAWVEMATIHPEIVFFGYTKIMDYAVADKPDNLYLHYSFGGRDDSKWNDTIPTCFIEVFDGQYPLVQKVCSTHELGYEDYFYILSRKSFKIGVH